MPVLEYCSAVWCSAADTHLRLLDRVVSGASFLTVGVFACDLAHRRSVSVLCMLHKIRCNPMHPLYGALPTVVERYKCYCLMRLGITTKLCTARETVDLLRNSQDISKPHLRT